MFVQVDNNPAKEPAPTLVPDCRRLTVSWAVEMQVDSYHQIKNHLTRLKTPSPRPNSESIDRKKAIFLYRGGETSR